MTGIASADISRLSRALRETGRQSYATTQDVLVQSANYILSEMEARVPVDTGNLRDSLGIKIDGDRVIIGADPTKAPYAIYVELGTKPHVIEAKNGKALAFQMGGQQVVVRKVNHPGTKANPFMEEAFQAWVDSLGSMAAEANIKVFDKEMKRA